MGGRGSSGSRGQGDINMEPWEKKFFLSGDLGRGGVIGPYREYMRSKGISEDDIDAVRQLLSEHSGYHYEEADKKIVEALESNSSLGEALRAKIDFEEKLYKMWISEQSSKEDSWKSNVFDGEKVIYRKGERKSGVEPWTVNEEGADMGYGGIGYDHRSTVEQMFKEGYHLLGGAGLHHGSPGEAELTFVKYSRRKK